MSTRIVVLHGTTYWSMGDLGLMIALIHSLQWELNQPEITILSPFTNRSRPAGQSFDIAQLGVVEKPGLTLYPRQTGGRLYASAIISARAILALFYLLVRRLMDIRPIMPRDLADSVNTLYEADLIISKPGGFLYDYGESHIPAPHQLLTILAATLTGKPVVVYAQSIGPFNRPRFYGLVRFVLDRTRLILVRDAPSVEECRKTLGLRRVCIELTADEAFLLTGDNKAVGDRLNAIGVPPDVPLIGLTVLNWYFPAASDPQLGKARYIQTVAGLIDYINNHYGAHVVMFPFVLAGGYGHA